MVRPSLGHAQETYLNTDVDKAYADYGYTNQTKNALYGSIDTNAALHLLSGYLNVWEPRTRYMDGGDYRADPVTIDGVTYPGWEPSDWSGLPGDDTDGTIIDSAIHAYDLWYTFEAAKNRTEQQVIDAYLDDRRHKIISVSEALGPLRDVWQAGTQQFTTIDEDAVPADASTVKYDDRGNDRGVGSAEGNTNMGRSVDFLTSLSYYGTSSGAKYFYKHARPWRYALEDGLPDPVPDILQAVKNDNPAKDGGFASGHTGEAWRMGLGMAYLVPQRYQEIVERAIKLGDDRIYAGMHTPLDVIGGRMLGTAVDTYIMNLENGDNGGTTEDRDWATIKAEGYTQTQEHMKSEIDALYPWLKKDIDAEAAVDLYVAANADKLTEAGHAESVAKAEYIKGHLTYGLEQSSEDLDQEPVVPKGAEVLLETLFPYLSADERRSILATTELPSGIPVMDDPEGYGRLNLYAAAGGYGAFDHDIAVTMDKSLGGFNAFHAWTNDIGGDGSLSKGGTGTLMLTGYNSYTGSTIIAGGMLVGTNGKAFGTGDVLIDTGGQLVLYTLEDDTMSNDLSGAGVFKKNGSGDLEYTGNASGFMGTTVIRAGTLTIDGNWGGDNTAWGSRDIVFDVGASSAMIDVTGSALLNGANLQLELDRTASYKDEQTYTLITAGTIVGEFGGIAIDTDSAFFSVEDTYTETDASVNVSTKAFNTAAQTANQKNAATALYGLDQTTGSDSLALFNSVLFMNEEAARNAFEQVSGELHPTVKTVLLGNLNAVSDIVLGRSWPTSGAPNSGGIWVSAFGRHGAIDSDGNAGSYDMNVGGLLVGGDASVTETEYFGLMAGWSSSNVESNDYLGSADIDSYHFGVYGGTEVGRLLLKGGFAYARNQVGTDRPVVLNGFLDTPSADYDSNTYQFFGEASYILDVVQGPRFQPFVGLSHAILATDDFSEAGGAAALSAEGDITRVTFTTLGLRAKGDLNEIPALTWNAMVGWRHAFGDVTADTHFSLANGGSFDVSGGPIGEDAALVSAGISLEPTENTSLGVSYSGEFSDETSNNAIKGNLNIKF